MAEGRKTSSVRRVGRPSAAEVIVIDRRIQEAAMAAFVREGFTAAQMEAIAAEAGVSKAALYRRYPNKKALLVAIIDVVADEYLAASRSGASGINPLERLKATMIACRRQRADPRQVEILRLIASGAGPDMDVSEAMDEKRAHYVEPVDTLIEEAIDAGLIRPSPVALLRETMFDLLVNGVTSQLMFGTTPDDDTGVFDYRWDLLMGMIGAPHRA